MSNIRPSGGGEFVNGRATSLPGPKEKAGERFGEAGP
jgi:hypothetical protein